MKIDPEDFRRHYATLSDEALLDINPDELVDVARAVYQEEVASRGLNEDEVPESEPDDDELRESYGESDAAEPDWLEHAGVACSVTTRPGEHNTPVLDEAAAVLDGAGIPSRVVIPNDPETGQPLEQADLMVPHGVYLEAVSLLDVHIFNPEMEATWKTHFSTMSDDELRAVKIRAVVAGPLDRAKRLEKAYAGEMAERRLRRDTPEDDGAAGSGS